MGSAYYLFFFAAAAAANAANAATVAAIHADVVYVRVLPMFKSLALVASIRTLMWCMCTHD